MTIANGKEPSEKPNKEEQCDLTEKIIGAFGKYQLFICILMFLPKIPVAFLQQSVIFLAPKVSYICEDTGNQTCPCENPIYDRSMFTNSVIMEWDLICERRWLNSLLQTFFYTGTLIGSPLFGSAADRFGRKWPFLVSSLLQTAAGIATYFTTSYWAFAFCRFLLGAAVGGVLITVYVICMEFIGKTYRELMTIIFQCSHNLGHMILPVFGYYFRNFYDFQLAISVPSLLYVSYILFVPETPRWLIAKKKTDEAVQLLERVAKMNNLPTKNIRSDIDANHSLTSETNGVKGTMLDLFRTPNMRKNILAMAFNWFSCSYCFFGVTQYIGQMGGNLFFNVWLAGAVFMIGTISALPLFKYFGRRTVFISLNSVGSACLLALALAPDGIVSVLLASLGSVAILIVFLMAYLYTSEMFPTVVRNSAMGFSSTIARAGAMIAPFVIELQAYGQWVPPLVFAVLPFLAVFVTLLLPETKGCELMTTLEEGENFGKKVHKT